MKMNLLKVSLTLLSAAGLASCGGNGGQPLTTSSIPVVMLVLNTTMLSKLPTDNTLNPATLAVPGGSLNSRAHIRALGCETVTPSPTTDADSDGIALLKVSTFNCNAEAIGTSTLTSHGSYTVKDLDDTKQGLLGGLSVEYALDKFNTVSTTTGDTSNNSYDGFWKYVPNGAGGVTSTATFNGHMRSTIPASRTVTEFEYGYTWNWNQTPADPANPWNAGALNFDGKFSLSGTFSGEENGVPMSVSGTFEISHRSSNLVYDHSCSKFYSSGSIFFDDYNNNVLEIRYACSTAKFYVNGVVSTLFSL